MITCELIPCQRLVEKMGDDPFFVVVPFVLDGDRPILLVKQGRVFGKKAAAKDHACNLNPGEGVDLLFVRYSLRQYSSAGYTSGPTPEYETVLCMAKWFYCTMNRVDEIVLNSGEPLPATDDTAPVLEVSF